MSKTTIWERIPRTILLLSMPMHNHQALTEVGVKQTLSIAAQVADLEFKPTVMLHAAVPAAQEAAKLLAHYFWGDNSGNDSAFVAEPRLNPFGNVARALASRKKQETVLAISFPKDILMATSRLLPSYAHKQPRDGEATYLTTNGCRPGKALFFAPRL